MCDIARISALKFDAYLVTTHFHSICSCADVSPDGTNCDYYNTARGSGMLCDGICDTWIADSDK